GTVGYAGGAGGQEPAAGGPAGGGGGVHQRRPGGLGGEHLPADAAQTLLLRAFRPGRPGSQAPEPESRPDPRARRSGGGAGGKADPAGLAAKSSFPSLKSVLYYNTRFRNVRRGGALPGRGNHERTTDPGAGGPCAAAGGRGPGPAGIGGGACPGGHRGI